MGKPYEQLKVNTKKLNKASKMDCVDELSAFFTCMSVRTRSGILADAVMMTETDFEEVRGVHCLPPEPHSLCGPQRNRFDIDTNCAKEKTALSACASASVRPCCYSSQSGVWSPSCRLTLHVLKCRPRRQRYGIQQIIICRDYHVC